MPPPRPKAHSVTAAAALLGVSRPFFYEHVLPELKVARVGRRVLVPDSELDRWLESVAEALPPTGGLP
jgi:excisionase family DNA binding protein